MNRLLPKIPFVSSCLRVRLQIEEMRGQGGFDGGGRDYA
jgi:hypothetical protein